MFPETGFPELKNRRIATCYTINAKHSIYKPHIDLMILCANKRNLTLGFNKTNAS